MSDITELYEISLARLPISEDEREVLKQVGYSLARQGESFRELQLLLHTQDKSYSYHSILGSPIELRLDWAEKKAELIYLERPVRLSIKDLKVWLAYTDLLLAPVLPLGSLVELRQAVLPPTVVESMKESDIPFLAVVLGRRMILGPESKEYIDYLVSLYPYGLRSDLDPIFIPNYYIDTVLQEGYSDAIDEDYVVRQYRKDYFKQNVTSETYNLKGEHL